MAKVLRHSQRKQGATGLPGLRLRRHPLTLAGDHALLLNRGKVYIRHVLTHQEYGKGSWKQ